MHWAGERTDSTACSLLGAKSLARARTLISSPLRHCHLPLQWRAPSLQPRSPENGNIREFSRRLSGVWPPKTVKRECGDRKRMRKSPLLAGFSAIPRQNSLISGLPGWRRSGIRTNLHAISLLTGNLTGKIAVLRLGQPGFEAGNPYAAVTIRAIPFAH
jgi:hypothetical protein